MSGGGASAIAESPPQVLLDARGHVMLTDFGFARVMAEGERSTSFCGTVAYMVPNVAARASCVIVCVCHRLRRSSSAAVTGAKSTGGRSAHSSGTC